MIFPVQIGGTAKLGDVGKLYCGQSPSVSEVNQDGNGTLYVTGPEQFDGKKIVGHKWTTNPKRMVPDGCIFITVKGAGVGKTFLGIACAIGRDVYAYEPGEALDLRYAHYAIIESINEIKIQAKGDIPGLSKNHILDHSISVPPLEMQREIVAQLEFRLSRLDKAVADLRSAEVKLKRHRSATLAAATAGRLVPTEAELARQEGRSYEPASALLERILAERRRQWEASYLAAFIHKGKKPPSGEQWKSKYPEPIGPNTSKLFVLPDGWTWASLDQLCFVVGGVTKGQKFGAGDALVEVPYLRVANVQRGWLNLREIKEITTTRERAEALQLYIGDILLNEGGDRDKLGRGWVWEGQLPFCIHQNHVFRARPISQYLNSYYIAHVANSFGQEFFFAEAKQTTNLASISLTKIRSLPIMLPPRNEQDRIVFELDRIAIGQDHMGKTFQENNVRARALRSSILQQAFNPQPAPSHP